MSAVRQRCAPVTRRFPDATGALVTYLGFEACCDVVGISKTTLGRWAEMGIVRMTEPLRGHRHYAVVDVALIKATPIKETQAKGIMRHPAHDILIQKDWARRQREATRPTANQHGQEWTSSGMQALCDGVSSGESIPSIAARLGRTYGAVIDRIQQLRTDGEIPMPIKNEDTSWYTRSRLLLTNAEAAMLDTA